MTILYHVLCYFFIFLIIIMSENVNFSTNPFNYYERTKQNFKYDNSKIKEILDEINKSTNKKNKENIYNKLSLEEKIQIFFHLMRMKYNNNKKNNYEENYKYSIMIHVLVKSYIEGKTLPVKTQAMIQWARAVNLKEKMKIALENSILEDFENAPDKISYYNSLTDLNLKRIICQYLLSKNRDDIYFIQFILNNELKEDLIREANELDNVKQFTRDEIDYKSKIQDLNQIIEDFKNAPDKIGFYNEYKDKQKEILVYLKTLPLTNIVREEFKNIVVLNNNNGRLANNGRLTNNGLTNNGLTNDGKTNNGKTNIALTNNALTNKEPFIETKSGIVTSNVTPGLEQNVSQNLSKTSSSGNKFGNSLITSSSAQNSTTKLNTSIGNYKVTLNGSKEKNKTNVNTLQE